MCIQHRGIWTWGHVIYDYRAFFRNMEQLGLNRIVIWNDILPRNAKDVLEEAHRRGIRLLWGFSWGWTDKCGENTKDIGAARLHALRESILAEFEQYKPLCSDGIYFQSFTETDRTAVGGIRIAQAVTELVNAAADRIFAQMPDLEIEFGLHATSVKNDLDCIAQTDPRIRIVWEDCGAFPFDYDPHNVDGFAQACTFTEKILHLRGKGEKCGFVFKGMTKLDWSTFRYHTAPYEIGTADAEFIRHRAEEKEPLWAYVTDGWQKNEAYVREMLRLIAANPDVTVDVLLEDGMFEYSIRPPAKMYAQMLQS